MIWLLVWVLGSIAVAALWCATRANLRAEAAYQLAGSAMDVHRHVANELRDHRGRLKDLESPDFNLFAEGGTTDG